MVKKVLVTIFALSLILVTGCDDDLNNFVNDAATNSQTEKSDTTSSNPTDNQDLTMYQTTAPQSGDKIAIITTNQGVIKVKLFPEKTPETVKNFETLASEGKYENVIFHRVIKDFMIQGGDFENANGTGGYSYKGPGTNINDEFSPELQNIKGALSMANAGPNTNGSQFFIVQAAATPWLNGKHSVFGQVYEGLDIVDKIASVEVDHMDKPVKDVVIEKIEVKIME